MATKDQMWNVGERVRNELLASLTGAAKCSEDLGLACEIARLVEFVKEEFE
jgi:hypothetical protein